MLGDWFGNDLVHAWWGSLAPRSPGHERLLLEMLELARDLGAEHADRFENRYAHTLMLLSQRYSAVRRYGEALATIDRALELVGDRRVDHYYQGYQATRAQALLGLERFDEVLALRDHHRELVELIGPNGTHTRFLLCMMSLAAAQSGRHAEVENELRELLEAALESGDRPMLWDCVWLVTLRPGFADDIYTLAVRAAEKAGPGRSDWRAPYGHHEVLGRALFRAGPKRTGSS